MSSQSNPIVAQPVGRCEALHVVSTAGRNLTLDKWNQYFRSERYREACDNLPVGPGAPEIDATSS